MKEKVVWYEGMLLRPQHFQRQERYLLDYFKSSLQSIAPYQWGVRSIKVDQGLLNEGAFGISRCEGILPDGTPFSLDEDDDIPVSLKLPSGSSNVLVFLGLPENTWVAGVNAIDGDSMPSGALVGTKTRFAAVPRKISDDNDFIGKIKKELRVARHCFELIAEDINGYITLPIARIKQVNGKLVTLDENFIPPCLEANKIPNLSQLIAFLERELALCIQTHVDWLRRTTARDHKEIDALLSLQSLNRFKLLLEQSKHVSWHPHQFYNLLLNLFSDLSTTRTKERTPISENVPLYQHDDLENSLIILIQAIISLLNISLELDVVEIPIEFIKTDSTYSRFLAKTSHLFKKMIADNARFYLTAKLPEDIRDKFFNQCFIAEANELDKLLKGGVYGIELEPKSSPPQGIYCDENTSCFLLVADKHNTLWKEVEKSEHGLGFHVKLNQLSDGDLKLWAVKSRSTPR
jgi:type VI secretion system protein ImpJ